MKQDFTPPTRRQFVKMLTFGGISSLAGTQLIEQKVMADIGVEFTSSTGVLKIRPSDYPSLNSPNGSIRIGVNPLRSNHQPNGTFHPILVNRLEDESLIALSAECTHASCAVRTYSQTAQSHICPCHGSRFAIDGRRLSGPAPFALDPYPSTLGEDGVLRIEVPRLGFTVNGCIESTPTGDVLKLEFPARRSVTYQVVQGTDVDSKWEAVPFSREASTPPSEMEFVGDDTFTSLYVPQLEEQGFYAVEVKVQDL